MTSLCFDAERSTLVVATARGRLFEYDMKDGRLKRTVDDVARRDFGKTNQKSTTLETSDSLKTVAGDKATLHWADAASLALLTDASGAALEVRLKRPLAGVGRGAEVRPVAALAGVVVAGLAPLRRRHRPTPRRQAAAVVAAAATADAVLVVQLRPDQRIVQRRSLPADAHQPPCLAWHWVQVRHSADQSTLF